jgi:hypothetical protein
VIASTIAPRRAALSFFMCSRRWPGMTSARSAAPDDGEVAGHDDHGRQQIIALLRFVNEDMPGHW